MAGGSGSSWSSSSSLMCKECNKEFIQKKDEQKHYKSGWHRYNLKRKMAGFPGVTEAVFLARRSALDEQQSKNNGPAMLCTCGKEYRSSKAYAQHLKSRAHTTLVAQDDFDFGNTAIVKSLPFGAVKKLPKRKDDFDEESVGSDEYQEIDHNVDLGGTTKHMKMDGVSSEEDLDDVDDDEEDDEVDPTCCFMCDQKHKTIERCMVHMHKHHGLFIPDIEYLKDPEGLLTYLGERVKHDYTCLYCNINCQPFESLEAVRMHMVAKSHCRVHYGDGTDEEEEAELDEFYDYSRSYVDGNGKQLVATDGISNSITLGCGGSELIITRETDDGVSTKALGSREYLRYYRQKPRPSPERIPVTSLQAARYRSVGLSMLQLKEKTERMKILKQVMKQMNRSGVETMRSKMSMRSNPTRNLRPMNFIH